jgi:cytochrome c oxidase subunit II
LLRATNARHRTIWRAGVVVLAMLATILAACSGARTNDFPTSDAGLPGIMPGEVVTKQGNEAASLYLPIFIVAVFVFILVEGLVLYVTLRFRRKSTDTELPAQTHGNNLLEVIWTAIPFAVVMVLFLGSFVVLTRVDAKSDNPAVTVDVTGFQWQWTFAYQDEGLSFTGAGKQGPEMVVPVNEPVRIRLHAQDVIHSFYVPAFFYKKDVVPGRTNEFDVIVEKEGTYGGQCAEFCGLSHADMYFTVRAVSRPEYDSWLAGEVEKANATPVPAPTLEPGASPAPVGEVTKVRTTAEAPLAFDVQTITAQAGTVLTVEYTNDSSVPHDLAFFAGPDATAPRIAATSVKAGPGDVQTITFDVPAEPGDYFFHCDVHPLQMSGTFEVTP